VNAFLSPSRGTNVTVIVRSVLPGMGTLRYMLGSNVVLVFPVTGHSSRLLIWPMNCSRMRLSSLIRWAAHAVSDASASDSPGPCSGFSTYGFFRTRFVSSWSASRR